MNQKDYERLGRYQRNSQPPERPNTILFWLTLTAIVLTIVWLLS